MARRSDHSREEQRAMAIAAGQRIIAKEGFASFSARKVAKEMGYTIGTIYNIFNSHDTLILHINAATLQDMQHFVASACQQESLPEIQIQQLAHAYLTFASEHYHRWHALFEHQMPADMPLPDWYATHIASLFNLLDCPFATLLEDKQQAAQASRTLWAGIHGICALGLSRKLDLVGVASVQSLIDGMVHTYIKGLCK
jgi:AcrR family transcriptional regulator